MPTRIVRDWTDSKKINKLTANEEVLFLRLIMKADDFGKYYADPVLLKSLLFPRKEGIRCNDIDRWIQNIEAAGLILTYQDETGDSFLMIIKFNQRLRKMKSSFPDPPKALMEDKKTTSPSIDSQLSDNGRPEGSRRKEVEVDTEDDGEGLGGQLPATRAQVFSELFEFLKAEKEKYFPKQCQNFLKACNILVERNLPEEVFKKQKLTLWNTHIGNPMRSMIEEMYTHYEMNNWLTSKKQDVRRNWIATMTSWMIRENKYEKAKKQNV